MSSELLSRKALRERGFVHVPNVVPGALVQRALRTINAWVGRGMPPERMQEFNHRTYCPEHVRDASFTDLLNQTPALELARAALGENAVHPASYAQVALRFPQPEATNEEPPVAHLDGLHTKDNGVPSGEIHNFAALVGVFLSDVVAPFRGNFTVWPGSHLRHAEYFAERGVERFLEGMPDIDIGPPFQIEAKAGDVVLVHYLVGHAAALNLGPDVRYAVFFRLEHADHAQLGTRPMCDPWLGWSGMQST